MNILIVDDNPTNVKLLRAQLEGEDHTVSEANDGICALEVLDHQRVDVVISDLLMPRMDGYRLCHEIRKSIRLRDMPIIVYTSTYNSPSDEKLALDVGADRYLKKPATIESFRVALREVFFAPHTARRAESIKELEALAQYSECLVAKLEEKNIALEQANTEVRVARNHLDHLLQQSSAVIYSLSIENQGVVPKIVSANVLRLLGFTVKEALSYEWWVTQLHPEDRDREVAGIMETIEGRVFTSQYRIRHKTGEYVWIEDDRRLLYDADGKPTEIVGVWTDITIRKQAEIRVRYMAHHDTLTGLPNRILLLDLLNQAIALARRNQHGVGVFILGLDHFKHVNDSLGYHFGDSLLESVTMRLRGFFHENYCFGRLCGDQFVIALPVVEGKQGTLEVAQKILTSLLEPFQIEGHQLHARGSIGIAQYPGDGESPEALLRAADTAMHEAKAQGRGICRFFTPELNEATQRRFRLSNDLHHACKKGEFVLHYQPQVSLDSGDIIGVETLVRWNHPDCGLISPMEFIPLLEEFGLMVEVGEWILKTACLQGKSWQKDGLKPVRMAVNLSAQQFHRGNIVTMVEQVLRETELDPRWLDLELTESLSVDGAETAIKIMGELKRLGVGLTLDDFGTGWSSLSYLKRFPLDRIKIDRAFIRSVTTQPAADAVVSSIVDLARSLGLSFIAEGVETIEQLNYLRKKSCAEIQGFLFSPAVPATECGALLRSEIILPNVGPD